MNNQTIKLTGLVMAIAFVAASIGYTVGHAQERAPFPRIKKLLSQPLDDLPGRVVRMDVIEFPPGAESPKHRHPGHVFVHVLEGEIVSQLEQGPVETFTKGQSFYEPTNGLHAAARNPSDSESAKILVFMIMAEDKPSLVLERDH